MIRVLKKSAQEGGKVILSHFRKQIKVSNKYGHQDLVTEADIASQKVVHATLVKHMSKKGYSSKDLGFIGEENLKKDGKHTFIIDPLDGTTNFASGIPYFCVCIAYFTNTQVQAGIVYNPVTNVSYIAQQGKGAYVIENGSKKRLRVTYKPLRECVLTTYLSSLPEVRRKQLTLLRRISDKVRGIRIFGAAGLDYCSVAGGKLSLSL